MKKEIEFACRNCLNIFTFEYDQLCFDRFDDLRFTPEPSCPRCGSTQDLEFSDSSQERIEHMIFMNLIKRCKA